VPCKPPYVGPAGAYGGPARLLAGQSVLAGKKQPGARWRGAWSQTHRLFLAEKPTAALRQRIWSLPLSKCFENFRQVRRAQHGDGHTTIFRASLNLATRIINCEDGTRCNRTKQLGDCAIPRQQSRTRAIPSPSPPE